MLYLCLEAIMYLFDFSTNSLKLTHHFHCSHWTCSSTYFKHLIILLSFEGITSCILDSQHFLNLNRGYRKPHYNPEKSIYKNNCCYIYHVLFSLKLCLSYLLPLSLASLLLLLFVCLKHANFICRMTLTSKSTKISYYIQTMLGSQIVE